MATFVLIHGAGDVGWHWHLVQRELGSREHEAVAPAPPCDHDDATLDYADTVVDAWPSLPTRFVLCQNDRVLPARFFRRLARERLGITPDAIAGGHCVALSRPKDLADLLVGYV